MSGFPEIPLDIPYGLLGLEPELVMDWPDVFLPGDFGVVGNTTLNTLTVTGTATLASLAFTSAILTGNLEVQGTNTIGSGQANYVTVAGNAASSPPTITAAGSDTNIPIRLIPKGTSTVEARVGLTVGVASSSGATTLYGPLSGSNRALYVTQAMSLSGSTSGNVARFETALSGSTSANPGIYTFTLSDNLQASAGVNWMIGSFNYGGTSWQGGRNGMWINVNSTADCTNFGDAFLVALAPWWRGSHYHNGYAGAERGSFWGINPLAWVGNSGTIGARRIRGVQAIEANVGSRFNVLYRTSIRVAEWGSGTGNTGIGRWQDSAMSFGRLANVNLPGHRTLFNLGDSLGWWPLAATGATFMEPGIAQVASDPTNSAAVGFMLPRVTFDYAAWWSPGAYIGGTGHIGGNTVGGTVLQTVSTVVAKTAVVGSVTVARGGLHLGKPTLTCSAPPSGGTTATLTVNTMGISDAFATTGIYGNRGTGYAVNDVLTLSGGTFTTAGQYTVKAVDSSGQIIDMDPTTVGSYTVLPSYPVTLTGGTGTGATVAPYWTILSVTVSGGGTLYSEQAPPSITVSGASGSQFQPPILIPVMTPTQAPLILNAGSSTQVDSLTVNASGPTLRSGTGAASGTQPKGSVWLRTDGGVGTTLYVSQGGGTWNAVAGV